MTTNQITSTHDIAEEQWRDSEDDMGVQSDIVATREADGKGIEFHVSMRDYTQRDMEGLIVEAAARVLVGEYGNNELAKLIEKRCAEITAAKVDKHLEKVTNDIIDQPVVPKFPFQSKGDEKPVTIREFIGLTGQAFLTARVDSSGNPAHDSWSTKPRIQRMVEDCMDRKFKRVIETATTKLVSEIQKAIADQHKAFLETEKARFREALAKVTG